MAAGTVSLSYSTTSNEEASATIRVTMTYYGNGQTWNSSPSSSNCYITLNGTTKYFTHAYTKSTSAQTMGYADFTINKTHSVQSFTATGGITNYSTVFSNPTGTCTVSVSAKTYYTISYSGNKNTGGSLPSNQTKWHGESLTLASNNLSRTGYSPNGWNTKTDGTGTHYASGDTYPSSKNANATLNAEWVIQSYRLTAYANSGSIASTSGWTGTGTSSYKDITYENSYGTLPTVTRANYTFDGWFTSANGGTQVTSNTTMGASATSIYAHWTVAYVPPTLNENRVLYRTPDSSGATNNGSGGYAKLSISWTKGSLSSTDINKTFVLIRYRVHGASSWTGTIYNPASGTTDTSYTTVFGGGNLDSDTQYDVEIELSNSGYESSKKTYTLFISTESFAIDVNATGTSIGLLTVAPDTDGTVCVNGDIQTTYTHDAQQFTTNLLQRATALGPMVWTDQDAGNASTLSKTAINYWDGRFQAGGATTANSGSFLKYCNVEATASTAFTNNNVGRIIGLKNSTTYSGPAADYVIENGNITMTSGLAVSWKWRKWNSGYVEAWGWYKASNTTFSNAGAGYYAGIGTAYFPIELSEAPYCQVSVDFGNAGGISTSSLTKTNVYLTVWSASSASRTCNISLYIMAKYA